MLVSSREAKLRKNGGWSRIFVEKMGVERLRFGRIKFEV